MEAAESLAASCSTYVPAAENVAAVLSAALLLKATVPGPLIFDQAVVKPPELLLALPVRFAETGSVIV